MTASSHAGRNRPIVGRRKRPSQTATDQPAGPADASSASLRQARYTAPRVPPDALRRARLVDFLHESVHNKLILLSAAAGYGKTSLLSAFAAETDYPVAWLALSEADRDLAGLLAHLVGALQARFGLKATGVLKVAAQPTATPPALAVALAREIEASIDDYFVLVLDDFHLVDREPAVIAFFDALLAHLPDQAHLIIAGRTLPVLRYAGLAAKQQMAGLSEGQLRFTPSETQSLLHLRNQVEMPAQAAESLVAETEGWITGILLTTHLMWQGLMSNLIEARQTERPLFEYLAAEVLEQQPPAIQQFLMESAVLPEMEADVCDAVLGRADSADQLRQAQARRLFINVVGADLPAYQYHHLFRDFLQAQLRGRDPARFRAVQASAADWYAEHDMPEAAVTFYVTAGHLDTAARLAESQAKTLFTAGRHVTLRQWADQLAGVADQIPRLFLFLASADADLGHPARSLANLELATIGYRLRPDEGGRIGLVEVDLRRCWLHIMQTQYHAALPLAERVVAQPPGLLPVASRALGLRYLGICQLQTGQVEEAEASLVTARQLLDGTEHGYDLALTLTDLAAVYRQGGKTSHAALAQQQALAIMRAEEAALSLAQLLNNIGWDMHMLGQYETALGTYAEALQWARRAGSAPTERLICEGQASLLADLGEAAQAASLYQQALSQAEEAGERSLLVYLACGLARLDRRVGNYAGALEWLRRAELYLEGHPMALPLANPEGLHGMIQVEMGHAALGVQALRAVCAAQATINSPVDLVQNLFYLAVGEFRLGTVAPAAEALTQAFSLAERIGYDQMLLREVPLARDMLEPLRQHPTLGPRISALLARAGALTAVRGRLIERGLIAAGDADPTHTPGLDVRALGVAQVLKDGVEIPRGAWGSQRPRDLFFYLVERMPLSKEIVLAAFWPEMPQSRAVANLYQTLYRLRRALGCEAVVLEAGECRLALGLEFPVDARLFEEQARLALNASRNDLRRMGALSTASALYRGDYLPELDTDWASERRRTLKDLHIKVLSEYADELLRFTRYGEARTTLARALLDEPLRDDLHGRMLMCLAAMGRRYEVVDHYRRYRELLRSELGLDPPGEIRQLYARLIE